MLPNVVHRLFQFVHAVKEEFAYNGVLDVIHDELQDQIFEVIEKLFHAQGYKCSVRRLAHLGQNSFDDGKDGTSSNG